MSETNIMPLHHRPSGRPAAQPPSCFSQLYALNQCYDDIMMMQKILQKVICDMADNNAEFQQCLANALSKVGAGMPIAGVTDGVSAAPGIVGEFVQNVVDLGTLSLTAGVQLNQMVTGMILQPGDWDIQASATPAMGLNSVAIDLMPVPTGVSNAMHAAVAGSQVEGGDWAYIATPIAQAIVSVPTVLLFQLGLYSETATSGPVQFMTTARRMR